MVMVNLTTKISKKKLLEIVKTNKSKHQAEYKEAYDNYLVAAVQALKEKLNQVERHLEFTLNFNLAKPVEFTKEYDKAIKMIELTSDKIIELDPHTFDCLVNDEWGWKHDFLSNTGVYLKK